MRVPRSPSRASFALATSLLLACLLVPAAQASPDDTPFFARPYKIQAMAADPWFGGLWIGTEAGLFFRDVGAGISSHYSVSNGLPHPTVFDVAVAPGEVWVATSFGVAVLDKGTREFHTLRQADGSSFLLSARSLLLDEGEAWVGTEGSGLFRVDYATRTATPVANPAGDGWNGAIWGLGAIGPDLYFSIPGYGFVRWDRETGETSKHTFAALQPKPFYLHLLATSQDVWIGTEGDGVMRYKPSDGTQTEYASPKTTNSHTVYKPFEAGNHIWFPANGGVARYDRTTDTWRSWGQLQGVGGINANALAMLDGVLYAGTAEGRIASFDEVSQTWQMLPWWPYEHLLVYNTIHSCAVDGDRLLFGTGGGGAVHYDPADGTWAIVGSWQNPNRFPDIGVFVTMGTEDRIYFGIGRGVTEMDRQTRDFVTYRTDGLRDGTAGAYNIVKDIAVDDEDAWFAAVPTVRSKRFTTDPDVWTPGGVTRMDLQTREMLIYSTQAGLSDANVTNVALTDGKVWIGMNAGLDVLDKATGQIQNVHQGPVGDIVTVADGVWVAGVADGVIRFDATTMQETARIPLPGSDPAWKILEHEGILWVGTAYHGLYAVDPVNKTSQGYSSQQPRDYMVNCMVVHDGLLYLGTPWGVERFDLGARRFLPQFGLASGSASATSASIAFDTPAAHSAVAADATDIPVSGRASGVQGAVVQVRVGEGPWLTADGNETWSATVPRPEGITGALVLSARLQAEGATLAQAARTVFVGSREEAAEAAAVKTALTHVPVLDVYVGDPLHFSMGGTAGLSGARATLRLLSTDGTERIALLAPGPNGTLATDVPGLAKPGQARYSILVQWDGGSHVFPATGQGFGATYPILVRSLSNQATARFAGDLEFEVPTGTPTKIDLLVQNTGTRLASFNLTWTGAPASWVTSVPSTIVISPASSQSISVGLLVPEGQKPGRYALDLRLAPPANEGAAATARVDLYVGGFKPAAQDNDEAGGLGVPLPAWTAMLALAVLAASARRRSA